MSDIAIKRTRAHIRYKLSDGTVVPGVTTIVGQLDKPHLVTWANRLGLEGIDCNEYRDAMAGVGTLVHSMILADLSGREMTEELREYSPLEISLAENAMIKFYDWRKQHQIEPILLEQPLVSETYRYGGTVDCYATLDGKACLVDFKTGKAIYSEMVYQLAAYRQLLQEHGHEVASVRIVRVGRDETEGFEERTFGGLDTAFEIFKALRTIYDLKKQLGGGF